MPLASLQASRKRRTHKGTAAVRVRLPFPAKSSNTHVRKKAGMSIS
jgi:hypothetical protein